MTNKYPSYYKQETRQLQTSQEGKWTPAAGKRFIDHAYQSNWLSNLPDIQDTRGVFIEVQTK